MNNLIFKSLVGSRAYGTNLETSDWDYKGVYIQNVDDLIGFNYQEQYEVGKDETYYEIRRFIQLLQSGNPTVLEMLFTNGLIEHPVWNILKQNKERFLTKSCLNSFGGYAVSQIKKARGLNKKMNFEKSKTIRKIPLDFCYVLDRNKSLPLVDYLTKNNMKQEYCGLCAINHFPTVYALYYDWNAQYGLETNIPISPLGYRGISFEESNDIRLSSIPKEQEDQVNCIISFNKDAYSIHCKEFNEYQTWLNNRNVNRYVNTEEQQIDGKNMLHCVRLLDMAKEIAIDKTIIIKRPNADYLLSIRQGKVNLSNLLNECETKLQELTEIYDKSDLPNSVDKDWCNNLLLQIRKAYIDEII